MPIISDFIGKGFCFTKTMPIHPHSLFQINIQRNANTVITLKQECSDNTKILDLKTIILKERNLKDLSSIVLKYNGTTMENDKTLSDYNIIDSKHIIKLIFTVKQSTHVGPIKKYSFIKDDNPTVNSNYNTLPLYAQPQPNCCEKFGPYCYNCCYNVFLPLFILFLIGYLGTSIGNSVALVNQYQTYNEYI